MGRVDLIDDRAVGREHPDERGIDARGITQGIQRFADDGFDRPATHVLEVDGNLGAGDVDAERLLAATSRPHARREDVG